VLWRLLRISLTGILQFAIANASWIGLVRIVSLFGSAAVAGYTVAIRVVMFFLLPAWGLSNAAATLVGQSLGARDPRRAEQAVWRTGLYNMLFLGALGVVFVIYARPVVALFVDDPAVVAIGARALRTFACGNIAYAWVMVLLQAFNGAGDTLTPTFVNLFGFWVLELPLAWWLATGTKLRAEGAFLSVVIAECSIAAASLILFRQGRWKKTRI
jgi:Na+-driven multidrug efflux pump